MHPSTHEYMGEALTEAKKAAAAGEVPIGAIIVYGEKIIARGHNQIETKNSATLHAEIAAINAASEKLGSWRLEDCSLYVTVEPCTMCIGAILNSRIKELYFGCYDEKFGAVGSLYDLSSHPGATRSVKVFSQVRDEECKTLLSDFFLIKR